MLTGLVAKNAILVVDYTNTLRSQGYSRREALLEAGHTRLRPILMTTVRMVFAMLPMAMKFGEGAEMRAPMAIVVIGGLITSTLLTLLVVPAAYTVMDDIQTWVGHAFQSVRADHTSKSAARSGRQAGWGADQRFPPAGWRHTDRIARSTSRRIGHTTRDVADRTSGIRSGAMEQTPKTSQQEQSGKRTWRLGAGPGCWAKPSR